jgi:hypothetical protein
LFPTVLLIAACCVAPIARAQTEPSEDAIPRVYLVTFEPGDEPYERFGHNTLVVGQPQGDGIAVNYGVFDFNAPNFIGNFVRGRMLYTTADFDWAETREGYKSANRSTWLQELNLTPSQRARLIGYLRSDLSPEHKNYRYDYFRNNCSTRVRDALDKAVDGAIKDQLEATPTNTTYRWHTRIGMAEYPLLYTGLELAMGPLTDRKLNAWQESFLPMKLMEHLNRVAIDDGAGHRVPLVKQTVQLYRSTRVPLPDRPPNWWWIFLIIGCGVGGVMLFTARRSVLPLSGTPGRGQQRGAKDSRQPTAAFAGKRSNPSPQPSGRGTGEREQRRAPRVIFLVLAFFWSLICTLAAFFMLGLWMFTDHEAGYGNENLFLFNPISLLVLAAAIRGFRWKHAAAMAQIPMCLALVAILLKVLPWFREWNWEFIALAVPAHIGLAIGVLVLQNQRNRAEETKEIVEDRIA